MSKKLLSLVILVLLSMFLVAGCGSDGSDGKDFDINDPAVKQAIEDAIKNNTASIATTSSETCAVCHGTNGMGGDPATHPKYLSTDKIVYAADVEQTGDFNIALDGNNQIVVTFTLTKPYNAGAFTGYKQFNSFYFLFNATQGTDGIDGVVRGNVLFKNLDNATYAGGATRFSVDSNGKYTITFPVATDTGIETNGTRVRGEFAKYSIAKLTQILALPEASRNIRILVTFTNDDVDTTKVTDTLVGRATKQGEKNHNYYFNIQKDYGNSPRDLYAGENCASCHNLKEFDRGVFTAENQDGTPYFSNYGYHYAVINAENCTVCHGYTVKDNATGSAAVALVATKASLPGYVHGIHASSHNDRIAVKAGVYYGVSYPNDMTNCATCHHSKGTYANEADAPARKLTANNYFTYDTCTSCHRGEKITNWYDAWDWDNKSGAKALHVNLADAPTANCQSCHDGSIAQLFHDKHSGWKPELQGYTGGAAAYKYVINSISVDNGTASVKWSVQKSGTNVNLLNKDVTAGPVFGSLTMYAAYGYGKPNELTNGGFDWTNEGKQSAQPARTSFLSVANGALVTNSNNSYDNATNVMTTKFKLANTSYENVGAVVIQGKPNAPVYGVAYSLPVGSVAQAFAISNGSLLTRRSVIDDSKCTDCHGGTLTLHGGSRVVGSNDGVQMCIVCHNPSATDQAGRSVTTLDAAGKVKLSATNSIDSKVEESIDMKTLIHRIHGATQSNDPYVIYRTRGIYIFRGADKPAGIGNTIYVAGAAKDATFYNDNKITYPQPIGNCYACHKDGAANISIVDQSLASPATLQQNVGTTRTDDVVTGPNQAVCSACHLSTAEGAHMTSLGYKGKANKIEMLNSK